MGGISSVHVGNASSKTIRVRVAQTKTTIQEFYASVGISGPSISLEASVKAKLDRYLDFTGFARIAPQEALEYSIRNYNKPIFVSAMTTDDPNPLDICCNYNPPRGRSILITNNGSIVLSKEIPSLPVPLQPAHPSGSFLRPYDPSEAPVLPSKHHQHAENGIIKSTDKKSLDDNSELKNMIEEENDRRQGLSDVKKPRREARRKCVADKVKQKRDSPDGSPMKNEWRKNHHQESVETDSMDESSDSSVQDQSRNDGKTEKDENKHLENIKSDVHSDEMLRYGNDQEFSCSDDKNDIEDNSNDSIVNNYYDEVDSFTLRRQKAVEILNPENGTDSVFEEMETNRDNNHQKSIEGGEYITSRNIDKNTEGSIKRGNPAGVKEYIENGEDIIYEDGNVMEFIENSEDDNELVGYIQSWITEEGICYSADMARRVFNQSDVDKVAEKLRELHAQSKESESLSFADEKSGYYESEFLHKVEVESNTIQTSVDSNNNKSNDKTTNDENDEFAETKTGNVDVQLYTVRSNNRPSSLIVQPAMENIYYRDGKTLKKAMSLTASWKTSERQNFTYYDEETQTPEIRSDEIYELIVPHNHTESNVLLMLDG